MVKKAKTQPKKSSSAGAGRTRKLTKKQQKLKDKKQAREQLVIPSSFKLVAEVYNIFRQFWKPLGGIVLVYLILNIIFASGLGNLSSSVNNLKASVGGRGIHFNDALNGFGSLVGASSGSGSQTGPLLQSLMVVAESLVIIWALRQLLAGQKVAVKQAYYQSMYPLVPFLLVVLIIIVQFLPITLGAAALAAILSSVFVGSSVVGAVFSLIFIVLAGWSIYMVSGSIFALYIVTLPGMEPRQALRSAKNLVGHRRWLIIRRLLFLPLFVFLLMGAIIVPLILVATWAVAPIFYVLSMLAILFAHSYLYSLYRSLLS